MDTKDRIYVAPKRGRLPRRYEFADRGPYTVQQKLRLLALLLFLGACIYGALYRAFR